MDRTSTSLASRIGNRLLPWENVHGDFSDPMRIPESDSTTFDLPDDRPPRRRGASAGLGALRPETRPGDL